MESGSPAVPAGERNDTATALPTRIRRSLRSLPVGRRLAGIIHLRYRWIVVALGAIGVTEISLHSSFFATLIPTLRSELGLSYSLAQSLLSAFALTYGLMQVPVGLLTDRFGARRVVLVSLAAFAAGASLTPLAPSYLTGLAARLLTGLGASAIYVPGLRLLSNWFPPNRMSTVMGLVSVGSSLGAMLALVLVPHLAATVGWRSAYLMAALTLPVVLVLYGLFCANRPEDVGLASASPPLARSTVTPIGTALRAVLGNRRVWPYSIASGLYFGSYHGLIAWLPTYLILELGHPATAAGAIVSLLPIVAMAAYPLTGFASDRLGRRRVFLAGALIQAATPPAFVALAPGLPVLGLAAFMPLFSLAVAGSLNGIPLAAQFVERRFQATAMGLANAMFFIGAFLAPIVLGAIVDSAGQPHFALFGVGGLALLAFA
ncbi:MAG: MFS transporter, partial [Chloroflexi bacterium]|nr:MFS transporter [Chloroflexota bacterium]